MTLIMDYKHLYFKLSEQLGEIRSYAIGHIFSFLSDKNANYDNPYKCDISVKESFMYGVEFDHITAMCIDEGTIYIAWGMDGECNDDIDLLSTEELLTILYEIE